jgi:hypothetical protein
MLIYVEFTALTVFLPNIEPELQALVCKLLLSLIGKLVLPLSLGKNLELVLEIIGSFVFV